jgi:hypothetical protein
MSPLLVFDRIRCFSRGTTGIITLLPLWKVGKKRIGRFCSTVSRSRCANRCGAAAQTLKVPSSADSSPRLGAERTDIPPPMGPEATRRTKLRARPQQHSSFCHLTCGGHASCATAKRKEGSRHVAEGERGIRCATVGRVGPAPIHRRLCLPLPRNDPYPRGGWGEILTRPCA